MGNHSITNTFAGGEIQKIGDKLYPRINGRLRLCHEDCRNLSIATSLIKFNGKTAIVKAISTTTKGSFTGHGMANVEQDENSDLFIIELAENRAIARSLRISGFGLEYECSESFSQQKVDKGNTRPADLSSSGFIDAPPTIHAQDNS
jgi:hypothetical protein